MNIVPGVNPAAAVMDAPVSIAESNDIRSRMRTMQHGWRDIVAKAIASARLVEALAPRVSELEQKLKVLDEIQTRLRSIEAKMAQYDMQLSRFERAK